MKRTQRLSSILLVGLLLILLSLPLPGRAQDGKPDSGQPGAQAYLLDYTRVTHNSVTDQAAAIAYNSVRREYLVAWERNLGGGEWGIFAQRLSSTGGLVGSEIPVATVGVNGAAAVAYNSSADQYLIVYTYVVPFSLDFDVYARRLSGAGMALGYPTPVDTGPTKQSLPSVAYNSINNEYLVVYQSETSRGDYEIRGRRVSAGGSPMGGSFVVATGGLSRRDPDVAYNPARNQYLAVYTYDYSGTDHDIYGQRLSNSGGLLGSEHLIWETVRDQQGAAVAVGSDEYLVVSHECDHPGPNNCDIVGRRLLGSGSLVPVAFNIAASDSHNRFWPDVAYAPGRFYMVAWHVFDGGFSAWNIRGRKVFPGQNVAAGDEFPIDDSANSQYNPAVVCSANGDCAVAEDDNFYSLMPTEIGVYLIRPQRAFVPLLRRW